ncbi:b0789bfa-39c6-471b-aebf-143c8805a601 [Sclerotinia trifoliorum]|uniref:Calmodulin n=1 Tax=Sclerotinia trifoliorum TaxID=28548 RepID=A0A8H2ZPN3_9HELO|nr:b0789bfa-39c6-471b-aebf-143c8805a601 [Sclerotinia trifoliorum]
MAKPLSDEEIAIFKEAFDAYDTDKGGNITVEEFGHVMKEAGKDISEEELAQIIKEVDIDGDGTINFDEFIAMMTGRTRQKKEYLKLNEDDLRAESAPIPVASEEDVNFRESFEEDPEEEWKSAWKEFDPSLNGSITAAQLRQLFGNLGESITDSEIDNDIMNSVDADDKISYREFVEFMNERSSAEMDIFNSY